MIVKYKELGMVCMMLQKILVMEIYLEKRTFKI